MQVASPDPSTWSRRVGALQGSAAARSRQGKPRRGKFANALVDALTSEPLLANYHLLPSVRGDLLKKLGRLEEARGEFERAASLTRNAREREILLGRAACAREEAPAT